MVLGFGLWVLDFGFWVLRFGFGFWFWILGFEFWILGFGLLALVFGFWILGKGLGLKFTGYNIKRSRRWVIPRMRAAEASPSAVMCLSGSLVDRGPLRD